MADAVVERRPPARFFCHRCNIEFEDVLQDYRCPYCASGFIEQLESETEGSALSGDDFSDADMSNLDDSDDTHQTASHPMLSDLAFLMSGGRHRGGGRPETLLEQLVYSISGSGPLGGAAVTAGAPFVLVGAPGDYVFGGEGLDAVVTQLLGQLENAGPPPLPREQIAAIPSEAVTEEQAAANTSCSVCWENFQLGEMVSKLQCEHIFHSTCIEPWLQLHATCPICRRSLLPEEPQAEPQAVPGLALRCPGCGCDAWRAAGRRARRGTRRRTRRPRPRPTRPSPRPAGAGPPPARRPAPPPPPRSTPPPPTPRATTCTTWTSTSTRRVTPVRV
ncbi:E3 ubiquitin-protein ligase RNF126-like [Cydia strobilella]|uniref:E3 ubiquitin-protein ligase RNF126-like n=1 Tax=Cydia strobilella TaxID=1100964 RepID=UPI003003CEA2